MATTTAGRQLTSQHGRQQTAIRAAAIADVLQVWQAGFDLDDIDESWRRMEPAVVAVTNDYRRQSSNVAAGYYQAFRTAEGAPGAHQPTLAVPPSREVLRYSLGFYGGVVPNQLLRTGRPDVARQAAVRLSGGVMRHVTDGGRDTVINNVQRDRQAVGVARITATDPCAFCAMLASRGPVYKSAETAAGSRWSQSDEAFKVHDHCNCRMEPVYSRGEWREQYPEAAEYRKLWNKAQREARDAGELRRGTSNDALNAFRRSLNAGRAA
jgi:hypothetical protein